MNKYCYATLVTTEKYIKGANLLQKYLEQHNCSYPLVAMISDNINPKQLHMKTVIIPDVHFISVENEYLKKFYCLNLLEYEKIVFLDADIIINENIDFLFKECVGNVSYGVRNAKIQDFYPHGGIIYFEPNEHLFNDIIKADQKYRFTDDEDVLNRYFSKAEKITSSINYMHFGGPLKYWESKYFNENMIWWEQIFRRFLSTFNKNRK